MGKKVLAILLILLIAACLVMGCSGKKSSGPTPSAAPITAPQTSPSALASSSPGQFTATPGPTAMPSTGNNSGGSLGLDASLADLSGEGQDEEGFPEAGLPTPTLD